MTVYDRTDRSIIGKAKTSFRAFAADESGNTMIEYGLLLGMISVAILTTLGAIGGTIRDDVFGAISDALSGSTADSDS
ncbi:Flp family type IVb pilin [Roseibium polysiphoniae]|uniref:Flp family type IVb pilin n=1 Tax=Roseibium polysiphoniae TaxID=2571221 RepID=A0A927Q6W5_9HYPH|nr:Flp family type IVb pilin [Roseibium polysiphoniae]MBD8877222.1 Flp family type IVb pilin [Roseibium polysiphoniae]MBS8262088.1 Flp family type IVb pilin [Roseibium polysiphoniae]